jgi:hypothetical protein
MGCGKARAPPTFRPRSPRPPARQPGSSNAGRLISPGTCPDREVVVADLAGIAEAALGLSGPGFVVVVGDVVSLRERLLDAKLYLSQRFG